jgi:hypothetical protein
MTDAAPSLTLTKKLEKLIPLLASNHDGEVVATARAIGSALAAEGFDLHDLAGSLVPYIVKRETVSATIAPAPVFEELTLFERRAWLEAIRKTDWLTPFERDRIEDVYALVRTGIDFNIHWRKKRTIDAALARAVALGVRP